MSQSILGLDIGGANLKAAHSNGAVLHRPFALWSAPEALPLVLRELLCSMPEANTLAVTMTGELCDCFPSKRQGVQQILSSVQAAADTRTLLIWNLDQRLISLREAQERPLSVAAGNWLALACWVGRQVPSGSALLLDIGSTTTDIIPLHDGQPVPRGRTDPERLLTGELVYTGARRTPVCAILGNDELAAEFFATSLDAHVLLGNLPEAENDTETADRRPATREFAHSRLARMLGADLETSTPEQRLALAERVQQRQREQIGSAIKKVTTRMRQLPRTLILSGSGEFLGRQLHSHSPRLDGTALLSLAERWGPAISEVACAHALVQLALNS